MNEYVKEITRIPLLSDEETNELIKEMYLGNKAARDKLIKHNMRAVVKIAFTFNNKINLSMDELISIGSYDLIKAIDNYDINKNVKLSTFIYKCVLNGFKKYIQLSKSKKRDESKTISLQDLMYKDDDMMIEDTIENKNISIEEDTFNKIRDEKIRNILKKLTAEEQEILLLRYGIIDNVNHTLEEIAQIKGVTGERIRQKEAKALKKLKHPQITKQIKDFFED